MKSRLLVLPAAAFLAGLCLLACSEKAEPPKPITNSLGMEFRLIPAGSFMMGSSQADHKRMMADFKRATGRDYLKKWHTHIRDETPCHKVVISRSFYLQTHEVTNEQFAAFVKATGHRTTAEIMGGGWVFTNGKWRRLPGADWRHPLGPGSSIQGKGLHPVVQVSWNDAEAFCRWLSKKESKNYALPTEAQWEYACRGGREGQLYSWGSDMPPDKLVANMPDTAYAREYGDKVHHILGYDDGHSQTSPVGTYQANGFGLRDMIGNVWEWCSDWYEKDYYKSSPAKDPRGPSSGKHRVLRGGAFCYLPSNLRCADRFRNRPSFRSHFAGFRVVRVESAAPAAPTAAN